MTTILLVDDHQIVRQGLRALLEAEPDLFIVGEAADGLEVTTLVDNLKPDVLIIDLMLPGLPGLEVARRVRQRWPQIQVVILSMHANEAYVIEALKSGAVAYVLKDSGVTDLVQAVRMAAVGRRYLSPPLSEQAIEIYLKKAQTTPSDPYEALTGREREVLQLAAEGFSSNVIAARLSISPRTAEAHRASILRKLGLQTQTDLVRFALRRGILSLGN